MKHCGLFITFEGPEGAGKSSQLQKVADLLSGMGKKCVCTREPGGTQLAEKIRSMVKSHSGKEPLYPITELLLMEAARCQHVNEVIIPALKNNEIVLCDRFIDSTVAYQAVARGLNMDLICNLNRVATQNLIPDLTILMDLPVEVGFVRARKRQQTQKDFDRFEAEQINFHNQVREAFLSAAKNEKQRFRVIDANRNPNEVFVDVKRVIYEFI